MRHVALTVDLESDCPPHLDGWRGMREGAPRLLDLLAREGVSATFFTTSRAAEAFPDIIRRLVAEGHELGCHGRDHRPFAEMTCEEAEEQISRSMEVLRRFAPVISFRAPHLHLPEAFLPFLEAHGLLVDASRSRYKPIHWLRPPSASSLARLVTSTTSSVLRLPALFRDRFLLRLPSPVVLFVHPWEFVDLTGEELRWDCRFGTGDAALEKLTEVIRLFRGRGDHFVVAAEAAGVEHPVRARAGTVSPPPTAVAGAVPTAKPPV